MNPRAWWAGIRRWYAAHSQRDRRVVLGVAVAAGLSLVYVGVVQPVRAYRLSVAEEIVEGQEELERAARFMGAAEALRTERDQLAKRVEQAKTRLLPGDTGTLGAAALQERTGALAAEKGITVQSTQVMKEEPAEPFHKVSVRLTVSGELKPFADFMAGLEYGPQALTIPFVEVSRRGAIAGQRGPRTLSATVEVGGYLLASAKAGKPEGDAPESEGEAGPPPTEAEAAPAGEGGPVPARVVDPQAKGDGPPPAASPPAAPVAKAEAP